MARNKADIDLGQVELMASRFCKNDEIAKRLDFDPAVYKKRSDVDQAFEKGRNAACIGLRTMLYDAASSGDRQAIIFLAKNELGYRDYPPDADGRDDAVRIVDDVEAAGDNG